MYSLRLNSRIILVKLEEVELEALLTVIEVVLPRVKLPASVSMFS